MKRMKKLLALVLAMMMAFSTLAMPTMAHEAGEEGIMPLYEVAHCPECYDGRVIILNSTTKIGTPYISTPCIYGDPMPMGHSHRDETTVYTYECMDCGKIWTSEEINTYCITTGRYI